MLATLLGLGALAACGSSTPSDPPSHNVTPLAPTTSAPVTASPTPTTTPTTGHLTLLPPSCTKADGIYVASTLRNGAGGVSYDYWRLKSRTSCTLNGVPSVTLYDGSGEQVPAKVSGYSGWFGYKDVQAEPTVLGPTRSATIQIAKYRCDTTPDAPEMTAADFTLPLGPEARSHAGKIHVKLSLPLLYCPHDEGNQDVHVAPLGYTNEPAHPYAVNLRSVFDPGDAATWGAADMDGDGADDVVIVRPRQMKTSVVIDYADGTAAATAIIGGMTRLQALSDLNGDGTPEILLASTASPSESGYAFGDSGALVLQLVDGRLALVDNGKPQQWQLTFSTDGRGDLWAGVRCRGEDVVQVSALVTGSYDTSGTNAYDVTRTTWHIEDAKVTKVSSTKSKGVRLPSKVADGVAMPVQSSCPGMGANGWAG